MQKSPFTNLINPDVYQVFLFACRAHIPFSLGLHPWFVINKKGKLSRYEVRYTRNKKHPEFGHIRIDDIPPFEALSMFHFTRIPRWNTKLLATYEGNEAQILVQKIESSLSYYPYKDTYRLLGPNSNTYVAWMLRQASLPLSILPSNAFGKKWKD